MKKTALICLLLAGCANTSVHRGILYSFHQVKDQGDGSWYLELVGGLGHSQSDLLEITNAKATEVCKSKNFTIDTTSSSKEHNAAIPTGTSLGFINVTYPVLKSVVKCK